MNAPFFIVGSGRSGSTLLRLILCAHSSIAIPPETYFIKPLLERLPAGRPLDTVQISLAVEIITGHYRWPDMGLTNTDFEHRVAQLENPTLKEIVNVVYDFHLEKEGKYIWGDKTPPYVSIIPGLVSLYPDARIIHLVRDGRDVTKSFQSTGWYGPWLHANTQEWKDAVRHIGECRQKRPDIDICEVRYEDLVLETEATVRYLCGFLGVAFESGMLNWAGIMDGRIPEREVHIHRKLHRKPQRKDVLRWQTEMSGFELFVVEAFLVKDLMQVGYEPHFRNIIWQPVFILCRLYCKSVLPLFSLVKRALDYVGRRLLRREM